MSIVSVASIALDVIWPSIFIVIHHVNLSRLNRVVKEFILNSILVDGSCVVIGNVVVSHIVIESTRIVNLIDNTSRIVYESSKVLWLTTSIIVNLNGDSITAGVPDRTRYPLAACTTLILHIIVVIKVDLVPNIA